MPCYIGRFAPSPTGALHAGSLVAALASWLDARAHGGKWLVRIEDVDTPRCQPGAAQEILRELAACGLHPDEPPVFQSQRTALYQSALDKLISQQAAYPCNCSRKDIQTALLTQTSFKPRHGELIYPGTCRAGLQARAEHIARSAHAWRMKADFFKENQPLPYTERAQGAMNLIVKNASSPQPSMRGVIHWPDRRLGLQQQDVVKEVGDFVIRRSDGLWAYQLAVVVDDAQQGITHVVRGEDLADNTARQILLQRTLGVGTPLYLHTPLVLAADGHKLSKQNGAEPLALNTEQDAVEALRQAADKLGLRTNGREDKTMSASTPHAYLSSWVKQWPVCANIDP
jgi:glutamyl-Q tRNA(Asp) synthetase